MDERHFDHAGTIGATRQRPSDTLRVLAVDDSQDAVTGLVQILRYPGHEVGTALDGASALDEARGFLPDVILLDIGLPMMHDYQVVSRLREEPSFATTRLVALPSHGQEQRRARSRESGFEHHLVRTVESVELMGMLDQFRNSRSSSQPAFFRNEPMPGEESAPRVSGLHDEFLIVFRR
jgi:CheY-like chemotaxis protein